APPRPARSATARFSSSMSGAPCASAPGRPTPTPCERRFVPRGDAMTASTTRRRAAALGATILASCAATPALAQSKIDPADTAWMIAATALVLAMTLPGLALFYAGMVRKKNVLATMAQSVAATMVVSLLWVLIGYSLAFTGDAPALGNLERVLLLGMGMDSVNAAAKTIPEAVFMIYQMTFAIITVALVGGSVADRMKFSA